MYPPIPACLLSALLAMAVRPHPGEGLVYRARLTLGDGQAPQEARLRVVPLPPRSTRNRRPRARLGTWRLEVLGSPEGGVPGQVLARTAGYLFLGARGPGMAPTAKVVTLGGRARRIWNLQVPQGEVHLVEVGGGLLALQHFEGPSLDPGVRRVTLDLESLRLSRAVPAVQEGQALLRTLKRLGEGSVELLPETRVISD